MRCPYCSNPAVEYQEECPRCGFTLHKLEGWFGAIPRLNPGISDNAALFAPSEHKKLEREISRFQKIFPQVSFHLVTVNLNPGDNLALYTFWIFNRSGICGDMAQGGENHNVLMILDAINARACLTAGYGLEPFLGERHLAAAGSDAAPEMRARNYAAGAITALQSLTRTLIAIHDQLDVTYGIDTKEIVAEEQARAAAAAEATAETVPNDSLY